MDRQIGDTCLYHYNDDVVDNEPETHKEEPSAQHGSEDVGDDQNEADSSKNLLCAGVRWNIQYR